MLGAFLKATGSFILSIVVLVEFRIGSIFNFKSSAIGDEILRYWK